MFQDEHLTNIHKKTIIGNSIKNVVDLTPSILLMPMMISARVQLNLKFQNS